MVQGNVQFQRGDLDARLEGQLWSDRRSTRKICGEQTQGSKDVLHCADMAGQMQRIPAFGPTTTPSPPSKEEKTVWGLGISVCAAR